MAAAARDDDRQRQGMAQACRLLEGLHLDVLGHRASPVRPGFARRLAQPGGDRGGGHHAPGRGLRLSMAPVAQTRVSNRSTINGVFCQTSATITETSAQAGWVSHGMSGRLKMSSSASTSPYWVLNSQRKFRPTTHHRHVPHLRRRLADDARRTGRRHQPAHGLFLPAGVSGGGFRTRRGGLLHRAGHVAVRARPALRGAVAHRETEGDMTEAVIVGARSMPKRRRRRFTAAIAGQYLALVLTVALTVFPLVWLFLTSIRSSADIFSVPVHIIPETATLTQYVAVFAQYDTIGYVWNTVIVSVATVVLVHLLAIPCAYALSRFRMPGAMLIFGLLLIMRMIPVIALAIPLFAVFAAMGLLDTVWALILSHTAAKLPVAIWLLLGFIQDVPKEIEEAAQSDGAGTVRTLVQIVAPLIAPGIGASAVITFLFTWNDLLLALTLTSSKAAQTLPVGPTNFVSQYGIDWGAMSAAGVLMVIPTLVFVWFAQGLLVKGLTTGAVRG
ncbi:carbohydrate ABC transporter permease [Mesorhizobium sp. M2A.F.Ca.ET.043.05.1.1]|nr:carbohydrate ABC transporter permease [Mesorhizobium sp. M2A.F.Ca.ET.043.05.1.1]